MIRGKTISLVIALFAVLLNCAVPGLRGQSSRIPDVTDSHHPHHKVYVPAGYTIPRAEKREFGNGDITVEIYARKFAQGNAFYVEIYPKAACDGEFSVRGASLGTTAVLLSKREWGYRGIVPVHGDHAPGKARFIVQYALCGSVNKASADIDIQKTDFPFNRHPLDLGKYSNASIKLTAETVAFIQRCADKKKAVFGAKNPDYLGQYLSHPRDVHHITSPFWSRRVYINYRYEKKRKVRLGDTVRVHGGLDLRGKKGEPVFAMADGLVAIAEHMYYEGNFVVLDHGNRVFTYYMHLDDITVREGSMVKGGDLIGHVGSSGISTAPHLHVSLMVQGYQVDPLSLLPLPIKN